MMETKRTTLNHLLHHNHHHNIRREMMFFSFSLMSYEHHHQDHCLSLSAKSMKFGSGTFLAGSAEVLRAGKNGVAVRFLPEKLRCEL